MNIIELFKMNNDELNTFLKVNGKIKTIPFLNYKKNITNKHYNKLYF